MTRLLAIETSSEACSVAISVEGEILEKFYHEPRMHAELILPAVSQLLAEAGIRLSQLDAIAFGRGPGSFTSLRIGIGVVQGLAWGAELGVVPVSSLAALARGAAMKHGASPGLFVVAAMDARMDEVFHASYQLDQSGTLIPRGVEDVGPPGSLQFPEDNVLVGAGNGFERYDALSAQKPVFEAVYSGLWPSAVDIIALAGEWLSGNEPLPAHQAQPLYIRDNVAKKPAAK